MNDCPRPDDVYLYLDGDLAPADRAAFEAHLDGCGSCRQRLAGARALYGLLDGLAPLPVPAGLQRAVLDGLPGPAPALPRSFSWLLAAQLVLAGVLLALAYRTLSAWAAALAALTSETPSAWLAARASDLAAVLDQLPANPAGRAMDWLQSVRASLADLPRLELTLDLPPAWGLGLTWPQLAVIAAALLGLWLLANRLLLAPEHNTLGG